MKLWLIIKTFFNKTRRFLKRLQPRSLLGKFMLSHIVVLFITLLVMGLLLTYLVENYFFGAREVELTGKARDVAYLLKDDLKEGDINQIENTVETVAFSLDVNIRVIDEEGNLLTVSSPDEENPSDPDEQMRLEEPQKAHVLEGNMLTHKIYGPYMQKLLVAAPIEGEQKDADDQEDASLELNGLGADFNSDEIEKEPPPVIGMVALSAPLRGVEETISQISQLILYSGAIGAMAAGFLALSLATKMTLPLQKISRAALNMASGNFRQKIHLDSDDEIGSLAQTFNYSVEQVEKTIEEQKRLEEFRRQLVANVSHELRAPLSSMRGYAELMLDGVIKEEDREKYLNIILNNSIHLSRLVEDLLNLSRLESGEVNLNFEELDPRDPARLSFESMLPQGNQKGVKLVLEEEENLPLIKADRSRIHEILTNLLENAVEFSPPEEVVTLRLYRKNNYLVYEVEDRGKGIPPGELDHIWERFYKVDKSRRRSDKGSGLGLSITRQLVEMHQGYVEVESQPHQGSIFRAYLPITSS